MIFFSPIRQPIFSKFEGTDFEKETIRLAVSTYSFSLDKNKQYSFGEFADEIEKVYDTKTNYRNKEIVDVLRDVGARLVKPSAQIDQQSVQKKFIVVLKQTYLSNFVSVFADGKKLDPRHCYLMSRMQIGKLDGYYMAAHSDTEKERARQSKYALDDNYVMEFIDVPDSAVIETSLQKFNSANDNIELAF